MLDVHLLADLCLARGHACVELLQLLELELEPREEEQAVVGGHGQEDGQHEAWRRREDRVHVGERINRRKTQRACAPFVIYTPLVMYTPLVIAPH